MKKIISDTLAQIEKQFGKEAIMLLGAKAHIDTEVFPSGSLVIDHLLGVGGYPKGRIIEIFGPESSGKTTITLHAIAEVQKAGGVAAFIDAEHAIDPGYAARLGVDINNLILSQPDSGEQALEIVDTLTKTGAIDLIVVDSVAALVPEVELAGEMRDQTVGAQARLMAKALRKLTGSLSRNKTTIIFINQVREKIGVVYGNPEVTPGGRALKFFASIRIDVRKAATIDGQGEAIGTQIRIKIVKNKLAAPFKSGTTEIIFAHGISKEAELIDLAEKFGVLERKGAWYKYQDQNLAQGRAKLRDVLRSDNPLYNEINAKVQAQLQIQIKDESPVGASEN